MTLHLFYISLCEVIMVRIQKGTRVDFIDSIISAVIPYTTKKYYVDV